MTNLRTTLENAVSDLDTAIERECLEDVAIVVAYMREALAKQAEPSAPMPRMIWDACSQGGLWKCDRTGCDASYCSPPWSREDAARDHQGKCTSVNRAEPIGECSISGCGGMAAANEFWPGG